MLRFIQIPKFWNISSVTVNNSEVDILKSVTTSGFAICVYHVAWVSILVSRQPFNEIDQQLHVWK